ncbi:MAG: NADH-quinone oxidoreductase subunit C [Verrucomicrobia bacterium]|nr:NADH-quinone oxidoreductase subunit C [Verrucomicrobiota bacterium]
MPTTPETLAAALREKFGILIGDPVLFRGEASVQVTDPNRIVEVADYAKNQLALNYLVDISSLDHYGEDPRWTVVYELRGLEHKASIRLRTSVSEEKSELPSVTGIWRTANWHEREIYDMMGIRFSGHPDLRRILMWDGYPYFPLRKDFPLAGKPSELPDIAFTRPAPLEGGPFVTVAGGRDTVAREPRARNPE